MALSPSANRAFLESIRRIKSHQLRSVSDRISRLKHGLWWRLMPGREINLPWPKSRWITIDQFNQVLSGDPNDHYRPWLEANVGRQCWDWDWKIREDTVDDLVIRFRRGKEHLAVQAALMWGE